VIASFLMGRPDALDPRFDLGWGEALVNADLPLMRGELARARAVAASDLGKFKDVFPHVPEQVRTRLVLAEIERREGQTDRALAGLEREAPWILRSGSVEHLSLYHLIRSRALTDRGEYEAADSESREGLILTRQCRLGLAHVDFLNLRSRLALARARSMLDQNSPQRDAFLEAAARSALGALHGIQTEDGAPAPQPDMPLGDLVALGAQHPECQYAWGEADALVLLGEVLTEQGRPSLARDAIRRAGDLQSTLQHPDLARTEELLSRLGPWE
jgi:tetratricopeptide (TPR) repeat protein